MATKRTADEAEAGNHPPSKRVKGGVDPLRVDGREAVAFWPPYPNFNADDARDAVEQAQHPDAAYQPAGLSPPSNHTDFYTDLAHLSYASRLIVRFFFF